MSSKFCSLRIGQISMLITAYVNVYFIYSIPNYSLKLFAINGKLYILIISLYVFLTVSLNSVTPSKLQFFR